jgi:glycosyltransferase involved in cell wall biosynthesis
VYPFGLKPTNWGRMWIKGFKLGLILTGRTKKIDLPEECIFVQSHVHPVSVSSDIAAHIIRIHDIFPISNPEWFSWPSRRLFIRSLFSIPETAHLLCDSVSTKESLSRNGLFLKNPIETLYCCVDVTQFKVCKICNACTAFSLPIDFALAVGTIEPRKNYEALVDFWRSSISTKHLQLVIVGKYGWKSRGIRKMLRMLDRLEAGRIIWLEDCCDGMLDKLYVNAQMFISASLDEGFDIPAAEANRYRKILYLSRIPVHTELYSKAFFFDPKNLDELGEILTLNKVNEQILLERFDFEKYKSQVHAFFEKL